MSPTQPTPSAQPAPVTGYGRRFNALKSGWTAESALLPGENKIAFLDLLRHFFIDQSPQGPVEVKLVTAMAKAEWRAMRIESAEADVIKEHGFGSKVYSNWNRYLREARGEFYKAMNALMALRRLAIQQERHDESAPERTISTRARRTETNSDIWLEKVLGQHPLDILDEPDVLAGLKLRTDPS